MKRRAPLLIAVAMIVMLGALAALRTLARSRSVQAFGTIIDRVDTSERLVALTFDDGPSPARLDSVLAPLAARGVHATFFVIGRELAEDPEAGRRIVSEGHELGNHTWSHRRMVLVAPATARAEIERTDSLVRDAGHAGAIHFRPPYGYKLFVLPWYLSRRERTTVTWDVEPDSYSDVAATSDGIVRHVMERVRPGSIIILHPWYASRATSLAAIGPLIDSLQARGYRVVPVRDLLR
jgi:peptidoglycan/xylan/chitin deacetylase (PgdA/CDA1 family)